MFKLFVVFKSFRQNQIMLLSYKSRYILAHLSSSLSPRLLRIYSFRDNTHSDGYTRIKPNAQDHEYVTIPFSPASQLFLLLQRLVPRQSGTWNRMLAGDDTVVIIYWKCSEGVPTEVDVMVSVKEGQLTLQFSKLLDLLMKLNKVPMQFKQTILLLAVLSLLMECLNHQTHLDFTICAGIICYLTNQYLQEVQAKMRSFIKTGSLLKKKQMNTTDYFG